MKRLITAFLMMVNLMMAMAQSAEQLLLEGWRFHRGQCEGAEQTQFDDRQWPAVRIPHDWAIGGPFDKDIDKQVVRIEQNGEKVATEKTGRTGSLPWIGEGWYRREIEIPEGFSHAELIFDGAMSEPQVYLDGKLVGFWAYGYTTFRIDITGSLPTDRSAEGRILPGKHTLAVHLNNREASSRWYPGAGLYRPVRLRLGQRFGLETWGTFCRTTMLKDVDESGWKAGEARLTVSSRVRASKPGRGMSITHLLKDSLGNVVAEHKSNVADSGMGNSVLLVKQPSLWGPEHPVLYTLVTRLADGDRTLDETETAVGIRSVEYNQDGFRLNGKLRKFKGVCLHHDLGPLGAAFYKDAFRRQVRLLKDMGCDAIRTSHNIPAPWQMDICDEMGMMVMAESFDSWVTPKCPNSYSIFFDKTDTASPNADGREWWKRDLENLVTVNRNHPSIVMWSIGNEVPDQTSRVGYTYTVAMQNFLRELDSTRPITQGLDQGEANMNSGVWQATEIPGFNYRLHLYHKGLENAPMGIVLGTETASTVSSRGVYHFPVTEDPGEMHPDCQVSSYDLRACWWSNLPDDDWVFQDKCPWVTGEFVWTGFDYLGEPTPYDDFWPSRSSYFGIYDLAGLPKDRVWLYRTHWAPRERTLHLLPHWNWEGREGQVTPVFCYTSYPEAELFINGKSQGRRKHHETEGVSYDPRSAAPVGKNRLDRYRMRWMDTVYEPGELKVVAYDENGNKVDEEVVRTASKPHHVELQADREFMHAISTDAEGRAIDTPDLTFITARILDKDGNLCPESDTQLSFTLKGESARFNSCCNGDATSTESFTLPTMHAFKGQLVIVVEATKSKGNTTLSVTGKNIKGRSITIKVE